jgi:polyisoprenoid-binding protein YceI
MHALRLIAVVVVCSASVAGFAEASTWRIDSAHSSAQFAVRHLLVSTVRGHLGEVAGTVQLDEADVTRSSVDATVDPKGVDTRDAKRDEHLRSADFLDVAKYPTITFRSKKVQRSAEGRYQVVGDLTLHGVTREVTLDVEGSTKPITDPWGNVKLGGVARTKIDRQDFGVSYSKVLEGGGLVVGNEIEITIDIELTRTP